MNSVVVGRQLDIRCRGKVASAREAGSLTSLSAGEDETHPDRGR